jgi:copper chaperone CopZ
MTTTFTAPTISCGGCARNVRAAMSRTPGVSGVEVDVPAKRVAVTFDAAVTSPERIAAALTEAGFAPAPEPARG